MEIAHQFQKSCKVEERWSPVLDRWLAQHYNFREATPQEQWRGIDRILLDGSSIDYKCDEQAARTGNAFIEYWSNVETGRRGWAVTSEATWIVYFVSPNDIYVITMDSIGDHIRQWHKDHRSAKAQNETYTSKGILVPLSVLEEACEYVAHLDRDDGPVFDEVVNG